MKNNYNDVIDVISKFNEDDEILNNTLVSGSIVPYLIEQKECPFFISDLCIYVKAKKMDFIRKKIIKLSKEYDFDIESDSTIYSDIDYGFKIKYQDTMVRFYPYSIIDNNLIINSYEINKDEKIIRLKQKKIPDIIKSDIIRRVEYYDRLIRIFTPEFILSMMEVKDENETEIIKILDSITDEEVVSRLRIKVSKAKNTYYEEEIKSSKALLIAIIVVLLILAGVIFLLLR